MHYTVIVYRQFHRDGTQVVEDSGYSPPYLGALSCQFASRHPLQRRTTMISGRRYAGISPVALALGSVALLIDTCSARTPDFLVVVSRHGVRRQFPSGTHDFAKYAPGKVFETADEVCFVSSISQRSVRDLFGSIRACPRQDSAFPHSVFSWLWPHITCQIVSIVLV